MAEQISIERQQCRMLVEAIKKIVTNPRTPNWIKNPLETAVKEAKALKPSETTAKQENVPEETFTAQIELDVGVECIDALDPGDKCLYKIVDKGLEIDHVQLYNVQVIKGDKKTPMGIIMHNVPATYLRGVRRLEPLTE
jgi:hypothetical protein